MEVNSRRTKLQEFFAVESNSRSNNLPENFKVSEIPKYLNFRKN